MAGERKSRRARKSAERPSRQRLLRPSAPRRGAPPSPGRKGKRPDVAISNPRRAVRVQPEELRRLAEFLALREGVRLSAVDLAVVDAVEIAALNRRCLGHNWATDVLSFDLSDSDSPGLVAQVVASGEAALREGPLRGHSPHEELLLYVIHGLLHVIGYEDATIRGAARMHAREDALLEEFLRRVRGPGRGKKTCRDAGNAGD